MDTDDISDAARLVRLATGYATPEDTFWAADMIQLMHDMIIDNTDAMEMATNVIHELTDLRELADNMYWAHDSGEEDNYGAFGNYFRKRWSH